MLSSCRYSFIILLFLMCDVAVISCR